MLEESDDHNFVELHAESDQSVVAPAAGQSPSNADILEEMWGMESLFSFEIRCRTLKKILMVLLICAAIIALSVYCETFKRNCNLQIKLEQSKLQRELLIEVRSCCKAFMIQKKV